MKYHWSNCLFWALCARLRLGGRIIWRRSVLGPFLHFAWTDGRHIVAFNRIFPRTIVPPPVFRGRMHWNDKLLRARWMVSQS